MSITVRPSGPPRQARCRRVLVTLAAAACHVGVLLAAESARPRLGINLSGLCDWNSELPFVDGFRLARAWISQRPGTPWGQGPKLDLDEHGWVTRLEPGCTADTPLFTLPGGSHYPGGDYTVLYEGEGKLDAWGAATVVSRQPGALTIKVDPAKGGLFLKLVETTPGNHVRNLRVPLPGFEKTFAEQLFHPAFLARWQGVACVRFMDWMATNGATQRTWAERPRIEDATWTTKGAPVEIMVELANRLKADAWFCLPHRADDDYVRSFARLVRDRLAPGLKVYIEYSNEVWNSMFEQTRYAQTKGQELGLGPKERPWEGGGMYYARRSVEIFRLWEQEFGGRERLVRVLAWQAANAWWSDNIVLPFEQAYKSADALAIAPYMTLCVGPQSKPPVAEVETWSLDALIERLATQSLPECCRWIQDQKRIADKYGLHLVAYEGGQHLVGVGGGENSQAMETLFRTANADPRMGQLYDQYLDAWTTAGGDLFCHFSSVGIWSKWGSWGVLQFADDDPRTSPKLGSILRWARRCGQTMNLPQ